MEIIYIINKTVFGNYRMNLLQRKIKKTEYFDPADKTSGSMFCKRINDLIKSCSSSGPKVIVCIGTDRATGDALGPIVGSIISDKDSGYHVYGTLKSPVHALNIRDCINTIYSRYDNPVVIAIDASLGHSNDVGMVTLCNSPLLPGIGVNKKLPAIGDISITGIVNISGRPGINLLQSTRLYTVKNMADYIADSLILADTTY